MTEPSELINTEGTASSEEQAELTLEQIEEQRVKMLERKNDHSLEQLKALVKEEEVAWADLEISLDQMQYSGRELFAMQAQIKAISNALIEGDWSDENLNKWLNIIVLDNMSQMREAITPMIKEAKLAALRAALIPQPHVDLPWDKMKPGGNSGR